MKDNTQTLGIIGVIVISLLFIFFILAKISQPEKEPININTELLQESFEQERRIEEQALADYEDCVSDAEKTLRTSAKMLCSYKSSNDEDVICDKFTMETVDIATVKSFIIGMKSFADISESSTSALEQYNYDLIRCDSL